MRQLFLVLLAVCVLAGLACGGGSGGSVKYAPTVVPIKRIDFNGVQLTFRDYVNPPSTFVDQYPQVVAQVNGKSISGMALATVEVMAEMRRREALALGSDLFRQQILAEVESTDPLEALIDEELKHQAVERLGLLPSVQEAVEYTRKQEHDFLHPRGTVSPGSREQTLELLQLQGVPTADWASSKKLVEAYRQGIGVAKLQHGACRTYATPRTPTPGRSSDGCAGWLQRERANAYIVYYVRWAG